MGRDVLRRVRWGNVARALAIPAALAAIVAWPRLASEAPPLPPDTSRPLLPAEDGRTEPERGDEDTPRGRGGDASTVRRGAKGGEQDTAPRPGAAGTDGEGDAADERGDAPRRGERERVPGDAASGSGTAGRGDTERDGGGEAGPGRAKRGGGGAAGRGDAPRSERGPDADRGGTSGGTTSRGGTSGGATSRRGTNGGGTGGEGTGGGERRGGRAGEGGRGAGGSKTQPPRPPAREPRPRSHRPEFGFESAG